MRRYIPAAHFTAPAVADTMKLLVGADRPKPRRRMTCAILPKPPMASAVRLSAQRGTVKISPSMRVALVIFRGVNCSVEYPVHVLFYDLDF